MSAYMFVGLHRGLRTWTYSWRWQAQKANDTLRDAGVTVTPVYKVRR